MTQPVAPKESDEGASNFEMGKGFANPTPFPRSSSLYVVLG